MQNDYSPRSMGVKVVNSLVIFALWIFPWSFSCSCNCVVPISVEGVTYSQSLESIFMEDITCTLQRVSMYLLFELYCTYRNMLSIRRKKFHQIMMCVKIPTINYSGLDSWRLNQYGLLSNTEPNYLLSSRSLDPYSANLGGHRDPYTKPQLRKCPF